MATKQFYATGDFKYGTRMLRAGDPVEMDAPKARLYNALGKITDKRPRQARAVTTEDVAAAAPVEAKKPAAAKRAAPRKRKPAVKK